MKKELNNNRGSALIWVLVICIIFGILGMAIGAIALSMNNRSINNNLKQQTYFTARSAVDAVFAQFNGDDKKGSFARYLNENLLKEGTNNSIKIDNFFKDSEYRDQLGDCTVTGSYDATTKIVTLTATAKKGSQEDTVVLTAKETTKIVPDGWPGKDGAFPLVDENSKKVTNSALGGKKEDIYCYRAGISNVEDDDDKDEGAEIKIQNKSNPVFIYVESGVTLRLEEIELNGSEKEEVDVFFYIESGGTLLLKGDEKGKVEDYGECNIYIYGEKNAILEVYDEEDDKEDDKEDDEKKDKSFVTINGGINVQDIRPQNHVKVTPKDPYNSKYKDLIKGGGGTTKDVWEKIEYKTSE